MLRLRGLKRWRSPLFTYSGGQLLHLHQSSSFCCHFHATRTCLALSAVNLASPQSSIPTLQSLLEADGHGGSGSGGGRTREPGSSLVMRTKIPNQEEFYFRDEGKSFCRLCQMEIRGTPKGHIVAQDKAVHNNHGIREIVLDSLTLLARQGLPIEGILHVWSEVLLSHRNFPRIRKLTGPFLSLHSRAARVNRLLQMLRDGGYLDLALSPAASDNGASMTSQRRRVGFEMLECIGDNTWGSNMSSRIMLLFPDKQWLFSQHPHAFNMMRDAAEMNTNLEIAYDLFDISSLLNPVVREKVGTGKIKADVVESIVGELHMTLWGYEPEIFTTEPFAEVNGVAEGEVARVLDHTLAELYDCIILNMLGELVEPAIPLAKELASAALVVPFTPQVHRSAVRVPQHCVKMSSFALPRRAVLHSEKTSCCVGGDGVAVSPLQSIVLTDATNEHGSDVFAAMKKVFKSLSSEPAMMRNSNGAMVQWEPLNDFEDVWSRAFKLHPPLTANSRRREEWERGVQDAAPPTTAPSTAAAAPPPQPLSLGAVGVEGFIAALERDEAARFLRIYPRLQSVRDAVPESENDLLSAMFDVCPFAVSALVPPGAKTPTVGVPLRDGVGVGAAAIDITVEAWKALWAVTDNQFFGTAAAPSPTANDAAHTSSSSTTPPDPPPPPAGSESSQPHDDDKSDSAPTQPAAAAGDEGASVKVAAAGGGGDGVVQPS